jgi:hypothetical protein
MRRLAAVVAVLCTTSAAFADEASNQDAAKRDAAESLTLLRLPEGAQRVADSPARDPQYLETLHSSSPNLVEQSEFWRVPGNPWDVFAWLKKHPPAGTRIAFTGSGGNRDGLQSWGVTFQRPAVREVMDARQLAVALAKATGGGTAVRADGVATWIVPRQASNQVPGGAATLQVTLRGREPKPVTRFSVSDPARIAMVTRILNRLPLVQPGVMLCPMARGIHARLRFIGRDGSVLADANAALDGCPDVELVLGGQKQPPLAAWTLVDDLQAVLAGPIDFTPFIGSESMPPPMPVASVAHGAFGGVPYDAVAYNGGPREGLCVQLFLAGVERGMGCLLHARGKRTSTFSAPACYPRELVAVGVLGRNARPTVRFGDGRTIKLAVHTLPHATVTTSIGLQVGRIVKLKRPAKVSLGYRGPFAFGFRAGIHELDTPWPLFAQC